MADEKIRGIHAYNQHYRRYEQVEKAQRYRLVEHPSDEDFDDTFLIRTCDFGLWHSGGEAGQQRFAAELGTALEEIGFAILLNHGIPAPLLALAENRTRDFYESIPESERQPYLARRQGSVNQGYFPIKETTRIHPDLVQGWVFCRRAFKFPDNKTWREADFWPRPGFEADFRRVVEAEQTLILPVMQSILRYLGCDPNLFDQRLRDTNIGLRLNYYPPLTAADRAIGAGRMLGHEDVDLFTFLPAPAQPGLQVLNRRNMKWIRLAAPPGSIIVNTGDYMQRITNDRLPSTTHRVSAPRGAAAGRSRVSFPLAVYLREEELLEVLPGLGEPRYPPIGVLEFHTRITSKYYGDHYAVGPSTQDPC